MITGKGRLNYAGWVGPMDVKRLPKPVLLGKSRTGLLEIDQTKSRVERNWYGN